MSATLTAVKVLNPVFQWTITYRTILWILTIERDFKMIHPCAIRNYFQKMVIIIQTRKSLF